MTVRKPKYLLDMNVLLALTHREHVHHEIVTRWFDTPGLDWGMCAFSEAGLLRLTANPKIGKLSVEEATEVLSSLISHRSYRFWPMTADWTTITAPFSERIFGHKQVTDAYLLGLAIKEHGILVTLDKRICFLADPTYSRNLLVLE